MFGIRIPTYTIIRILMTLISNKVIYSEKNTFCNLYSSYSIMMGTFHSYLEEDTKEMLKSKES